MTETFPPGSGGGLSHTNEPVYENDKVFLLTCNWTCPEVTMSKTEYFKTPPMLFKTKESAQEYIVNHKPCLSLDEVIKVLYAGSSFTTFKQDIIHYTQNKNNGS